MIDWLQICKRRRRICMKLYALLSNKEFRTPKDIQYLYNNGTGNGRNMDLTKDQVARLLNNLSLLDDGVHVKRKRVQVNSKYHKHFGTETIEQDHRYCIFAYRRME